MSHHNISMGDQPQIAVDKSLCFLLDERKDPKDEAPKKGRKKKKEKKEANNQPTFKNFGNRINVGKIKAASKMIIGWRIRLATVSKNVLLLNCGY